MNHTPLPWKIGFIDKENNQIAIIQDNDSKSRHKNVIAYVVPRSEHDTETQEANAYLISCAPELLQALKTAILRLNEFADSKKIDLVSDFEKLVAKAEGGL